MHEQYQGGEVQHVGWKMTMDSLHEGKYAGHKLALLIDFNEIDLWIEKLQSLKKNAKRAEELFAPAEGEEPDA